VGAFDALKQPAVIAYHFVSFPECHFATSFLIVILTFVIRIIKSKRGKFRALFP